MIKRELIKAFPTPILITKYENDLSKEIKFIEKQKLQSNGDNGNFRSKNTYLFNNKKLNKIKKFCEDSVDIFSKEIYFLQENLKITQSWCNVNPKGSIHHAHTHSNSIISGVFYLRINKDNPPIVFNNEFGWGIAPKLIKYSIFNSGQLIVPLKAGELILFPSSLNHSVSINKSKTVRLSLSFNTFSKLLGNEDKLTEMDITQLK